MDTVKRPPGRAAAYRTVHERSVSAGRPHVSGPRTPTTPALTFDIHDDLATALPVWSDFERTAAGTLYQNSLWCRAWLETVGASLGVRPRIVIARNAAGQVRFILPLQIRRRQGVRVLEWLTTPHHNYGYGLYAPDALHEAADWFAGHWGNLLGRMEDCDAILLSEMPDRLFGYGNPMAEIANLRSANDSFALDLEADFEALHVRKRKAESRRTSRKEEAALARAGELSFGLPSSRAETHALLDTMFRDQAARLAEQGIHRVFGPVERTFIHRLADLQDDNDPILAPYHLACNGEVLSVMLGGLHANRYWALISSLAAGPLRRHSPGDVALRRMIAACCERGLAGIDLSAGDSAYKRSWADEVIELRSAIGARNLRGLAWSIAMTIRVLIKGAIKRTPLLNLAGLRLRRLLRGRRAS